MNPEIEELFKRFVALSWQIKWASEIVQNSDMILKLEELKSWKETKMLPCLIELNALIYAVEAAYPQCAWCGDCHFGGPENCKR